MTPPRFQFTIRNMLGATFWVAVSCAAWTAFQTCMRTPNQHDRAMLDSSLWKNRPGPYNLEGWDTAFCFSLAVASLFVAIGVLFGQKRAFRAGAFAGIVAFIAWTVYAMSKYEFLG